MSRILQDLSQAELIAMVQELQKAKANGKSSIKVSGKGAVSVYGLQRFPVTLYSAQWERLLDMADDIRKFIVDNRALLATKEQD